MDFTKAGAQRRREIVWSAIRKAASHNMVCPTNWELADLVGYKRETSIQRMIYDWRDENRITVERIPGGLSWRVITFVNQGIATKDPRPEPEPFLLKTPVTEIAKVAADIWNVPAGDIRSKSRLRHHYRPRQAVCLAAMQQGWSSPHIGRYLGGRDHTTVIHGRDQTKWLCERDPEFKARVDRLIELTAPRWMDGVA